MILTEEIKSSCYEAYVAKFIDGDTVDMDINLGFDTFVIRRIRLLEIDAPEINNTSRQSEENKAGQVALLTLKKWFYDAGPIYYVLPAGKDIFSRWLSEIWHTVGQGSLNDEMKSYGYGNGNWSWIIQKNFVETWYKSEGWHNYGQENFKDGLSKQIKG